MDLSSTLKQMSDELAPVLLGEKAPSQRVAGVVQQGDIFSTRLKYL